VATGLTSGYHRDFQLLKEPLITALATVEESLTIMDAVVSGVTFNETAMAASCTREIYAADLALERALEGVPFRDAYRAAMSELENLAFDEAFVAGRIHAYRTIGSMGDPGLERYQEPLTDLAQWVEAERQKTAAMEERLRGPLAS
jgi:argininosuccinate lyase